MWQPEPEGATAPVSFAKLGIEPDDPVTHYVLRTFLRRERQGADLSDPEERARCVRIARETYRQDQLRGRQCVVYYLRINGLVKIGTAVDLRTRLYAYPPRTQVLATEPGSYALETVRLNQFREYLAARREWFHPGPRLVRHIQELRQGELAESS